MTISHIVTGVINWDKTIFVKRFPREGEEVKVERIIDIPGGKGANVAVASSRILGRDKVALFGALGSSLDKQLEVLRNEGILTNLIQFTRVPSGQAYIIVDSEGRNAVMTTSSAIIIPYSSDYYYKVVAAQAEQGFENTAFNNSPPPGFSEGTAAFGTAFEG
jgi:sugar/nucleoside kinase (ribokinase family)